MSRRRRTTLDAALLVVIPVMLAASAARAQSLELIGLAGQTKTITAADFAALPHVSLTVTVEGKTSAYRGAPLAVLLALIGAPSGKALTGQELRDIVMVTGKDGYAAALALAETDPMMRKEQILVADEADGHALGEPQGPYRLVVEGDRRGARLVRMVTTIEVRHIGPDR